MGKSRQITISPSITLLDSPFSTLDHNVKVISGQKSSYHSVTVRQLSVFSSLDQWTNGPLLHTAGHHYKSNYFFCRLAYSQICHAALLISFNFFTKCLILKLREWPSPISNNIVLAQSATHFYVKPPPPPPANAKHIFKSYLLDLLPVELKQNLAKSSATNTKQNLIFTRTC